MAMDRETLERQKEISKAKLEKRREAVPFEQLEIAGERNQLLAELLEVEKRSLAALESVRAWITFFGIILIVNLILTIIALAA